MATIRSNLSTVLILSGTLVIAIFTISSCTRQITPDVPAPPALAIEIKVAQALNGISIACNDTLNLVKQMMPEQSEDRQRIVNIIVTIVKANVAARHALETVSKNDLAKPSDVIAAITPALSQLSADIQNGLTGIKNEDSKRQAQVWLLSVGTAVQILRVALEVTNG